MRSVATSPGLSPRTIEILAELRQLADAPIGRTRAMPPAMYNSEEIYRLEVERIMRKEWVCPGLAAEIPNAGDYMTFAIDTQPVFCIRGSDGQIRSFSNVCRHRQMVLLEGRGNSRRVVCPYHAWTYDQTGKLIAAPHMQASEGFSRDEICLHSIRTEIWNGWIYITLNPETVPISKMIEPLHTLVERYGIETYIPIIHQEFTWKTNWKILNENFMEGYHGPFAHRTSAGQGFKVEETRFGDQQYDAFTYHTFVRSPHANYGGAHPDNKRLEGQWRYTSVLPTVYPTHMYSLAPDYLWYLSSRPEGTGQLLIRLGIAIPPEIHASVYDLPAYKIRMEQFFNQVNGEDRVIVEGIYRNSFAPLASGGPISWLERALHDFKVYLARRLTGELPI
jgi:phenylpropionate dioxygenase-like ring-hydroxylating dioxygenase large terminal subunit